VKISIKNRQQLLAYVAVGAVALFLTDKIIIRPLGNLWHARSERIVKLREKVAEGTGLLKSEQRIRSRWAEMQTNTLPVDASQAEQQLVDALYRWGRDSRVNVNGVVPTWKDGDDTYRALECRVDAAGSIDSLTSYLYAIEKDPMALKLQSVEISTADNEGQHLRLGLLVSGLVLTPPPQQPTRQP